jgi:hypothetical protein
MNNLRKYGESTTINFSLQNPDGAEFKIDAVHVSGDTKIMKNEGSENNTTNGFVDKGTGYSLILSSTEMEAARIILYFIDQGTKAWRDKSIVIETYGNTSAQHELDLDTVIEDQVWDVILTASTHNISTSSGRRLRDIASDIVLTGTSPNTAGTANTLIRIELDGDASSMDGAYDPAIIVITGGTGIGQARQIFEYDGTNKYAYINRAWKNIPDDTSTYTIVGSSGDTHVNEGLVTGGSNNTITLNNLASSIDDTYVGQLVFLFAGTGEDQSRIITAYNGTNKVATLDRIWKTNPVNNETIYAILPIADLTTSIDKIDGVANDVWSEIIEGALSSKAFLRIILAAVAGITTNDGTRFRDEADTKNRIVAVTDSSKNRTSITLDGSD